MAMGNKYGAHRVIEPKGLLPQAAQKIDNTMDIYDNEILIDVSALNIDSASFRQLWSASEQNEDRLKAMVLGIVAERGKMQNPVTGSGGMLMGSIAKIGPALQDRKDIKVGDRIASQVSLSLTPLHIDEILAVHPDTDRVDIKGQAILFESGIYAKLPDDMPESLALAALGRCRSASTNREHRQTRRLCAHSRRGRQERHALRLRSHETRWSLRQRCGDEPQ